MAVAIVVMPVLETLIYYFQIQRLQKLIYLHLPTDCFIKISLQFMGPDHSTMCFSRTNLNYILFKYFLFEVHVLKNWCGI